MTSEEAAKMAYEAVMKYDVKGSKAAAQKAIDEGDDLVYVIDNGFTKAIQEIGDLFSQKKLFLPHIMAAAGAMTAGVEVLTPEIEKAGMTGADSKGTVLICSIEGDIHSIGKDICAIMLKVKGFDVNNLGRDVPIVDIVAACKKYKPKVVGTSALMTSTMVHQKTLEKKLVEAGIRGELLTNVGGAPVTQQWADAIGADIYSENANDCADKLSAAVE